MNNSGTVALRVSALTAAAFVLSITCAAQESTRAASQPEDSSLRELDSQVRELRAVIEQMRAENAQSRAEMRELRQELQDTRKLLAPLATPDHTRDHVGLWWGRVALLATGYLYVSGRGMVLIRSVLELSSLQMRRDEDRTAGAIDVARGRAIGALERALALTLVLLGEYGAVGWIIAAKSLARFKALEEREFAEYFLIGTLASFLLAVLAGVGLRALLNRG